MQDVTESKSIDGMNPSTKEDFEELSKLIVGKLSNYQVRFSFRKKEKRRLSYCDVLKIILFCQAGVL